MIGSLPLADVVGGAHPALDVLAEQPGHEQRVVTHVLPHPPLPEWVEVRCPEIPGALGLDQEARDRIEGAAGRVADRVELVRAREAGEQRGKVSPLGRPAEAQVAERLANNALEETRQLGVGGGRLSPSLASVPAAYYTAAPGTTQP